MSHVFSLLVGVLLSLMIVAISESKHESFESDWCKTSDTGRIREYDEQVCQNLGKNPCASKRLVHVIKRQNLVVCKKIVWVQS